MSKLLTETVQQGDWKNEKHVPVIHVKDCDCGCGYEIKASIGDEVAHPNEFDHHIAWIKIFFQPEDGKFPVEVGSYQFSAHGEDGLYTQPIATAHVKTDKPGTVYALSYCNIHGLWENSEEIK